MFAPLLILTTGGMLCVLALCPLSKVAWPFVRLVAIVALSLTAGVVSWYALEAVEDAPAWALWGLAPATGLAALVILTVAPLLEQRPSLSRHLRWVAAVGGLLGLLTGLVLAMSGSPAPASSLSIIGYVLSAFLVGSVSMGWLLGHRYLTATGMTIDPLKRVSEVLILALGARWMFLVFAGGLMLLGAQAEQAAAEVSAWTRLTQDWLMVSVRIGVGLLLPSIGIYMAWECVRLRSTQSATGILFFTSLLIIIGELTSQYLSRPLGFPI